MEKSSKVKLGVYPAGGDDWLKLWHLKKLISDAEDWGLSDDADVLSSNSHDRTELRIDYLAVVGPRE